MFIEKLAKSLTAKNIEYAYSCKPAHGPTFEIFPGIKVRVNHKETCTYVICYGCHEQTFENKNMLTDADVNGTIREICRLIKLYK